MKAIFKGRPGAFFLVFALRGPDNLQQLGLF
jgi:hypothetical protein